MAHFQRVQTGKRIDTRIQGRRFRPGHQQPASKERRRICVLSAHNARMLECWGQDQPCQGPKCTHIHQSRDAVTALVRDGVMRWVGHERNVAAYTFGRTWKGVPSGGPMGCKVMQLV